MNTMLPKDISFRPTPTVMLVCLIAALSIIAGVAISQVRLSLSAILWCILLATTVAPVFYDLAILRRPIDFCEPLYLSSLTYVVIFVGPMAGTIFGRIDYPLFPALNLDSGLIFTTIGLLSFYLGYYLVRPSMVASEFHLSVDRDQRQLSKVILPLVVSIYCGITLGSLVLFWFPAYGDLGGYLALLSGFGASGYAMQGLGYQRALLFLAAPAFHLAFLNVLASTKSQRSWMAWLLLGLAGLVSVSAMWLTGNRVFILWNIGIPVILWHYFRHRLSLASIMISLGLAFVLVVFYTNVVRSPGSVFISSANAPSELMFFYVSQTGEPHVVSDLINRQSNVLDYQYGLTLVASLMNPIPRAWYPAKLPTAGELYTRYFFPDIWRFGVTYLGMPWLGELYLNAGSLGVILGMMITGLFSGKIYGIFLKNRRSLMAGYTYAMTLYSLYFLIIRGSLQAISFPLLWLIPGLPGLVGMHLVSRTRNVPRISNLGYQGRAGAIHVSRDRL